MNDPATIYVIETIDYPSEWYVVGAADSPEAALAFLERYWEKASKEHPSNPPYCDWRMENTASREFIIRARNPLTGKEDGWRLVPHTIATLSNQTVDAA